MKMFSYFFGRYVNGKVGNLSYVILQNHRPDGIDQIGRPISSETYRTHIQSVGMAEFKVKLIHFTEDDWDTFLMMEAMAGRGIK